MTDDAPVIRLILADDHPIVRAGLVAVLGSEEGLEVCGQASTPEEAVAVARREHPDVVLMDLQFGAGRVHTGVDATREIRALPHSPHVLVLTNDDTDTDILGAVEAGASGYLLKDAPPEELLAAIRAAAAGESALGPGIAARLLDRMRSPHAALTPREIEVLQLAAAGRTNAQIAAELVLGETTVKTHLTHVNTKLGVTTRTAAVAEARRRGVLR